MKKMINIYLPLLMTLILGCNNSTSKETVYNIPNNYKGVVVIVFEEKIKQETFVFGIPPNGILYSPYYRNEGIFIPKYLYVNKNGNITKEIKRYAIEKYQNELKKDTPYVLDAYDGKFSVKPKNEVNNSDTYSTKNWKMVNWVYFTIGNDEDERENLRGKANRIIDSLQQQINNTY